MSRWRTACLTLTSSLGSFEGLVLKKIGFVVKKKILALALVISGAFLLTSCSDNEVADVSLGIFTLKDIKLNSFVDPLVPGVTLSLIHI